MKKILIFLLSLICLFLVGCDGCDNPVDMSKAQVTFKHTIKLPAGFSIESSVPLNLSKLEQVGQKDPSIVYEMDKFSIPIDIRNDNNRHENTKIKFEYIKNHIDYLYIYAADGIPLNKVGEDLYEFDKDVLPNVITPLYVAGKTKEISNEYPYVGVDFVLTYLNESNVPLATNTYSLKINKINYTIPSNNTM